MSASTRALLPFRLTPSMSIKKSGVDEKVKVVCRVRPFLEHEAPDDSVAVEGSEIKITNQRNTNEIVSFR